ncbi:MAG: NTP transferase domain-containing protein [Thermoplasmata archaeon]|nr:NTP transferase domain-containing protein [Thermoplasmatales archaeon]
MLGIVMAGGRSSRMGFEKQLINFGGLTLLDIACNAIMDAGLTCLVAVSKNAPKTMEYAISRYNCIITPGNGYSMDVSFILNLVGSPLITVPSDLPFIKKDHVLSMMRNFTGKSMAGVLLRDGKIVYTGINIVSNSIFDHLYFFEDYSLSLNLNTVKDLEILMKSI